MLFRPPDFYLVFDVESVGLFGEGFAYGAVLLDTRHWEIKRKWLAWCDPSLARGVREDYEWVQKNIDTESFKSHPYSSPKEVRDAFWNLWLGWYGKDLQLAADVPFPVEARFLAACIEEDPLSRRWQSPYPLIDVASVRLAAGFDPLATVEREEDELPAHNPLKDAMQSARLLAEAMKAREEAK